MKLITYTQAAALLNIPRGTLYAWVHQNRVPYVRLGPRTVRFDENELREWVAARRRSAR